VQQLIIGAVALNGLFVMSIFDTCLVIDIEAEGLAKLGSISKAGAVKLYERPLIGHGVYY